MSSSYEELDYRRTELGELILRRRRSPGLGGTEIYEVKLDDELLMSSLLNESERALARLSIPAVRGGGFEVLVGGLGLGYTAREALGFEQVASVTVVELLPEVIEWHRLGLGPLGDELSRDPRCHLRQGDFFALLEGPRDPETGWGAILVDIDHAPDSWLHPDHGRFYRAEALEGVADRLLPGGVFGLWSSGRTDEAFSRELAEVFKDVETSEIEVFNPLIDAEQVDTIYVASRGDSAQGS